MKKVIFLAIAAAGFMTMGSSCTDTESTPAETTVQIDRMGRSGVNTAITDPFFRRAMATELARHNANAQDYNGNDAAGTWASEYDAPFRGTLAILDSLDTDCGNQLVADADPNQRYGFLATVLTDDRLYVNTASGSCNQYLAVEATAAGVPDLANDCGGRTPLHDTIDRTYSVLAIGGTSGVDDGIASDVGVTHSNSVFPFLAAPIVPQ